MSYVFLLYPNGGNMSITFEEIGKFFVDNLLWFLIPIDIAITIWIIVAVVQYRKTKGKKKKKGRKKNERKRQNKLSRPS